MTEKDQFRDLDGTSRPNMAPKAPTCANPPFLAKYRAPECPSARPPARPRRPSARVPDRGSRDAPEGTDRPPDRGARPRQPRCP